MNSSVMFSSASDNWETPKKLFDDLNAVFNFDLDAAASDNNAKCQKYFTVAENGLAQSWHGNVWLNPPYGRQIGAWVKKAYDEVMGGAHHQSCCYYLHALILHGIMIIAQKVLCCFCVDV